MLKESLLPAARAVEGVGGSSSWSGCSEKAGPFPALALPPAHRLDKGSLTLGRQAVGPREWAVGSGQSSRQGGKGHGELHVEDLQSLLLGRQA